MNFENGGLYRMADNEIVAKRIIHQNQEIKDYRLCEDDDES